MMIIKATKLKSLNSSIVRTLVTALDLMNQFGYSYGGARWRLHWLKKERLITNEGKGEYTITDDAIRVLFYTRCFEETLMAKKGKAQETETTESQSV